MKSHLRRDRFAGLFVEPFWAGRRRFKQAQPPAPPNPVQTAQAQTGTNISTAVANSTLGNTNQVTPTGSTTFNATGGYTDPTTGQWVPSYTETQSLNPTLTSTLAGTEDLANYFVNGGANPAPGSAAGNLASQIQTASQTPLNLNATPNAAIVNNGPQPLDATTTNALYSQYASFLNPQWQQQQKDLEDQLSRQGISVGSDAYNNAMTQFNNAKTQAYNAAGTSATAGGEQAAANMFGMALQGQQQNVQQQQIAQQQPLQLLSQLYNATA